jgi:hypothetical protein
MGEAKIGVDDSAGIVRSAALAGAFFELFEICF